MGTPEFDRSRAERKKVEMRFAHLKTHHRFERLRLRGLSGARDELHLAAIRAEPQNPRQPYLAAAAQHARCVHPRLNVRGVKRQSGEQRCRSPTGAAARRTAKSANQ